MINQVVFFKEDLQNTLSMVNITEYDQGYYICGARHEHNEIFYTIVASAILLIRGM